MSEFANFIHSVERIAIMVIAMRCREWIERCLTRHNIPFILPSPPIFRISFGASCWEVSSANEISLGRKQNAFLLQSDGKLLSTSLEVNQIAMSFKKKKRERGGEDEERRRERKRICGRILKESSGTKLEEEIESSRHACGGEQNIGWVLKCH